MDAAGAEPPKTQNEVAINAAAASPMAIHSGVFERRVKAGSSPRSTDGSGGREGKRVATGVAPAQATGRVEGIGTGSSAGEAGGRTEDRRSPSSAAGAGGRKDAARGGGGGASSGGTTIGPGRWWNDVDETGALALSCRRGAAISATVSSGSPAGAVPSMIGLGIDTSVASEDGACAAKALICGAGVPWMMIDSVGSESSVACGGGRGPMLA